jgi:hypothetical protein
LGERAGHGQARQQTQYRCSFRQLGHLLLHESSDYVGRIRVA